LPEIGLVARTPRAAQASGVSENRAIEVAAQTETASCGAAKNGTSTQRFGNGSDTICSSGFGVTATCPTNGRSWATISAWPSGAARARRCNGRPSRTPGSPNVGLPGETGNFLVNLLTEDHSRADARGRHRLLMEGYGYRWYRVGGLDYLLKRSDIDTNTTKKASHSA
jgi:hypothetical protein